MHSTTAKAQKHTLVERTKYILRNREHKTNEFTGSFDESIVVCHLKRDQVMFEGKYYEEKKRKEKEKRSNEKEYGEGCSNIKCDFIKG